MALPAHEPLVVTTRGGEVECVHYGSIAVVDASGRLVASAGDPQALNFTRSALKPFQALPFVEDAWRIPGSRFAASKAHLRAAR